MSRKKNEPTTYLALAGALLALVILVAGTAWSGATASRETADAAHSVSMLYMDELAGRREQVVEEKLEDSVGTINIAVDLMSDGDLQDVEHLRAYQRHVKRLFNLKRFAFVDANGRVYTADEGITDDAGLYGFDFATLDGPSITVRDANETNKTAVIAAPIRDRNISIEGQSLVVCFMEMDMDVMLEGVSMSSQGSQTTYCNLYTRDGRALTNTVLGGLAVEDNLIEALSRASYEQGSSFDQVKSDFAQGSKGAVSFTYNGIQETLSYTPVKGTDWMLTYLVRESLITERIRAVSDGIIARSAGQTLLTAAVLIGVFMIVMNQTRRNAQLALEKETSEAESRIKHQEMERQIALQNELLEQKAEHEQQERMITALASDYRGVYYIELDRDRGMCYQARGDIAGLHVGESFDYLAAFAAYCERYVTEPYREGFMAFVQPDAIRAALRESLVVSYTYMISLDGRESWEQVRFAGVRHLEDRDDGIVHSVGACFVDVDAETRAAQAQQQALRDALAAAEGASRAKTAFLSNMSHEIRTPMNAIIGLNSIALNEEGVPPKVRDYLKKTGDSAQHLLGIINDVLDMSRIESGRMTVKNEEFSFAKSLEQVNTIISGQCAEKGLEYDCHTVGTIDDYYVGDGMKLRQVMINILGNSVKFTPEGGKVTLLVEEGPRFDGHATLKLVFKDTGIGMSPEFLPHVFEAFSQEDAVSTSRYGSTGLGLPITKSIVELMNGHIEVESTQGVGTTFTVTIVLGESDRTGADMLEEALDRTELSVLAIDDDPIALEHAQVILEASGIACEVANSGEQGVEMVSLRHARRDDYDLVIVDWKMPGIDGVEATRRIREIVGPEMPIVILTSYNWDDIANEAHKAGVDSFVPKPLFAATVLDEFQSAFRRKGRAGQDTRASLEGRRVLLAEDMQVNAEIMSMVLGMREVEVDVAENGRVAVDKFLSSEPGHYDAILMDMRMPEMDGLEATRAIRAMDREDARTIPIIALTANAFDEDVQRSLQAGLNAHLSKPVEPETLYDTLSTLIK